MAKEEVTEAEEAVQGADGDDGGGVHVLVPSAFLVLTYFDE